MNTSLPLEALALVGEISNAARATDEPVPGGQSLDHRRLYDTVVRLAELLPTAEHLEAFSDVAGCDVAYWLLGFPFTLAGSGMPLEAAHLQKMWAGRIDRAVILGDRAVVLSEAGFSNDALEQIAELDREFPDDLWVQLKIGDALKALGEPEQAEARYRRGLGLAREEYDREGARERIIGLLYDRVASTGQGPIDLGRAGVAELCDKLASAPFLAEEEIRAILSARPFFQPYFRIFLAHRALLKSKPEEDDDGTDAQAIFFLGEFGDGEMIPDLLTCLSLDPDTLRALYGDSLTEHMWIPIAKAGHSRLGEIMAFVNDRRADEFARLAAVAGVAAMHRFHPERRPDAVAVLRELIEHRTAFSEDYLAGVLCDCGDNGLVELTELAEKFASNMADDVQDPMATAEDVLEAFLHGDRVRQDPRRAIGVFGVNQQWRRWQEVHDREAARRAERTPDPETVMRPVSAEPKIGRNDPCPCGSGKKYKKCHGG